MPLQYQTLKNLDQYDLPVAAAQYIGFVQRTVKIELVETHLSPRLILAFITAYG